MKRLFAGEHILFYDRFSYLDILKMKIYQIYQSHTFHDLNKEMATYINYFLFNPNMYVKKVFNIFFLMYFSFLIKCSNTVPNSNGFIDKTKKAKRENHLTRTFVDSNEYKTIEKPVKNIIPNTRIKTSPYNIEADVTSTKEINVNHARDKKSSGQPLIKAKPKQTSENITDNNQTVGCLAVDIGNNPMIENANTNFLVNSKASTQSSHNDLLIKQLADNDEIGICHSSLNHITGPMASTKPADSDTPTEISDNNKMVHGHSIVNMQCKSMITKPIKDKSVNNETDSRSPYHIGYNSTDDTIPQYLPSMQQGNGSTEMESEINQSELRSSDIFEREQITNHSEENPLRRICQTGKDVIDESHEQTIAQIKETTYIMNKSKKHSMNISAPDENTISLDGSKTQANNLCITISNQNNCNMGFNGPKTRHPPIKHADKQSTIITQSTENLLIASDPMKQARSINITGNPHKATLKSKKPHINNGGSDQQVIDLGIKRRRLNNYSSCLFPHESNEDQKPHERSNKAIHSISSRKSNKVPTYHDYYFGKQKHFNEMSKDTEVSENASIRREYFDILTQESLDGLERSMTLGKEIHSPFSTDENFVRSDKFKTSSNHEKMLHEEKITIAKTTENMIYTPSNSLQFLEQLRKPVLFDLSVSDGEFIEILRELGEPENITSKNDPGEIPNVFDKANRTAAEKSTESISDEKMVDEIVPSETSSTNTIFMGTPGEKMSTTDNASSYKLFQNDITADLFRFIGQSGLKHTCLVILTDGDGIWFGYDGPRDTPSLENLQRIIFKKHFERIREIEQQTKHKMSIVIMTSMLTYSTIYEYIEQYNVLHCNCGGSAISHQFDKYSKNIDVDAKKNNGSEKMDSCHRGNDLEKIDSADKILGQAPGNSDSIQNDPSTTGTSEFKVSEHLLTCPSLNIILIIQSPFRCLGSDEKPLYIDQHRPVCSQISGIVFKTLIDSGAIAHLKKNNIKCLNIISVYNLLTKFLDPLAIGLMMKNEYDILSKAVIKEKNEDVGVFYNQNGVFCVQEYGSTHVENGLQKKDIQTENIRERSSNCWINAQVEKETVQREGDIIQQNDLKRKDGSLLANIYHHYFNIDFIERVSVFEIYTPLVEKDIRVEDSDYVVKIVRCFSLEYFMSDYFKLARSSVILLVERENEFTPIKNNVERHRSNDMAQQ